MRIILLVFLVCLSISPAYAYKEDDRSGEAQTTAGDQNTNLHKLNSKGIIAVKKLKQASEYIERTKASGKAVNVTAFEDLLNSDQEDRERQELQRSVDEITKQIKNLQKLTVKTDHAVFETFAKMQASQVKDRQAVRVLAQQLKRGTK